MSAKGIGSILGGLPVFVEIDSGKDADTPNGPGEYWSEVRSIHWLKRNGEPGKAIPQSVYDRAERYDYGFCDLIEQVFETMRAEEAEPAEHFTFDTGPS